MREDQLVPSSSKHPDPDSLTPEALANNFVNYTPSGYLAREANTYRGVSIKYSEPPEAKRSNQKWIIYPCKGDEYLEPIPINTQSAYLLGRDRSICDIPIDHPSCSNQHAIIQFRFVKGACKPYIIDLESSNGTILNGQKIESKRYIEILEKDVVRFGYSQREYVFILDDH